MMTPVFEPPVVVVVDVVSPALGEFVAVALADNDTLGLSVLKSLEVGELLVLALGIRVPVDGVQLHV